MSSFLKLWESMNSQPTNTVDQAAEVIRTGIGFRENFWDEFKLLLNNSKGLSELLDIPIDKISTWQEKINSKLDEIQNTDKNSDVNKNRRLIKTGVKNEII